MDTMEPKSALDILSTCPFAIGFWRSSPLAPASLLNFEQSSCEWVLDKARLLSKSVGVVNLGDTKWEALA
ncbi:unnamed protein product [Prunus armeniaca]|uniref:Uncharacterized protein n=1 Tax=Prunus armeniaca TaxID=36596 RepID=A0A6J5TRG9_PRUAR|nr:unnamed protein product [Prunus armeniaca]